jgi:integrase
MSVSVGPASMGMGLDMRTLHRLTTLKVERAKKPGMYSDGGSLYLRVARGGQNSRMWVFRYRVGGRAHDMSLGSVDTFSLAEARERAREERQRLADGIDPLSAKRQRMAALRAADAATMTFAAAAAAFIKDNRSKWRSVKHAAEWESTLRRFAFPNLGSLPVQAIDTPLILRVIKPLFERVPVTAQRVRGRIEAVLGWCTVHHYRSGPNPAAWTNHLEHALPKRNGMEHHAALPYAAVPAFLSKLRQDTSVAAAALQFITLTACRLGEAICATWDEIDLDNRVWVIPATRTKRNREHRIPLAKPALAVFEQMQAVRQSDYVFPSQLAGRPLGDNTVWKLVKEAAGRDVTVHGLRSSFRDFCAERTGFPREIAEAALAHAVPSAVEAAYRRTDFFERRRALMTAWADFCCANRSAGVVPLRAHR